MNVDVDPQIAAAERRLSFECIEPNRIAGVSIGAINAAIIAGNPAEQRIERLRKFWKQVATDRLWPWLDDARSE